MALAALFATLAPTDAAAQREVDAERALALQRLLYRDPALIGIEVVCVMDVVFLWGPAPSEAAIRRAVALARQGADPSGATRIRPHLRVGNGRPPGVKDGVLRDRIERATGETASVRSGGVTLSAEATDPRATSALIERVRRIEGVRTIRLEGDP